MANTMPAIFFGHGNPMNAISHNAYTEAWARIGQDMEKPKGIVSISAHWFVPETSVTISKSPRTIHDFGGFPRELYQLQYSAPGDPQLAQRVRSLLSHEKATSDTSWGLDHGTWAVLLHVFPQMDIPVVQLSLNETLEPEAHYRLAKRLAPLRDEGILVMGSGNLVHNLHAYAWGKHQVDAYDWASRFEQKVRALLIAGDHEPLIAYESLGADAALAIPTPEHYLPLLYVIALRREGDPITFPVEGVDGGSISMLTVAIG